MQKLLTRTFFTALVTASVWGALPVPDALACGGFFCSQNAPVNQAAERIVFATNDDDTVTAVIQIMYEGPSENFSWLLPLSSVPDPESDEIAVSSDIAFQRLQAATNPSYSLTTRVEGTCKSFEDEFGSFDSSSSGSGGSGGGFGGPTVDNDGGVTVEASGVVGSFEWTVLSLDPSLDEPTDAAVLWLEDNDYDVTDEGAELIAPYLDEGMFLLALKLVKGADTGAIRPIVLTYDGTEPMIPIKLTAVAANDDMGVMTWLLGEERGIPKNYLSLELNEARINWFNAASNYNDVVVAAAKEAGGQGFVTEFAGSSETLSGAIWTSYDEYNWTFVNDRVYSSFGEMFDTTFSIYGSFDGFWEAVESAVTLPADLSFDDFRTCPSCYEDEIQFSPSAYFAAIEDNVIEPIRLMQDLFDEHAYTTRIYTTMSAADMTLDPLFSYNGALGDVSNVHTAERIIECNPNVYESEAPWRIELPQGGVIRGSAVDANTRTWPSDVDEQPANFVVSQLAESGDGEVVTDNADEIDSALKAYNDSLDLPEGSGTGGGGSGGSGEPSGEGGADDSSSVSSGSGGGGCNCRVDRHAPVFPALLSFGMLALVVLRRRLRTLGG